MIAGSSFLTASRQRGVCEMVKPDTRLTPAAFVFGIVALGVIAFAVWTMGDYMPLALGAMIGVRRA
jgi:hypothetical protein